MVASVQWLHYDQRMPTLARLASSTVTMYAADHLPPHFHVRMNDGREVLVEIATLKVLRGAVARRELLEALLWASLMQPWLADKWKELNP